MTQQIILECENVLNQLYKFTDELLFLGEPITDQRLIEFESRIGLELPIDFKYILAMHNSFSLSATEVLGFDKKFRGSSLENVYDFEHTEAGNPMFREFLPFSPDGTGNYYCLDLSRLENCLCPVIFWQHDRLYSDKNDVETCNDNFVHWIREVMIKWTLEHTKYNGSEK